MPAPTVDQVLDQALADHAGGRHDQAEAGFRSVLAVDPNNADALNLLGLLLQDNGLCREAIELISRALAIDPAFPEALTNLARVRRLTGDPEAACQAAERAVELDPALPEAHLQLAGSLIDLRREADAEAVLRRCLTHLPDCMAASVDLGRLLLMQGWPDQALAAFQAALRRNPDRVEAVIGSGVALGQLNRLDEALKCHRRAVDLAPRLADAHASLALTFRQRLEPLASADSCRLALAIAPDRADLWLLLGANLASLGQFNAVTECHERALSLNPRSADAWRGLSMIGQIAGRGDISQLQAILADGRAPDGERVAAGYSLGRLLESMRDFDAAFGACAAANRIVHQELLRTRQRFDLACLRRQVDETIATFRPALFAQLAGCGDRSDVPVFIVGMPRSGTSLVEQIAASHASVFGLGERKDIPNLVSQLSGAGVKTSPLDWDPAAVRALADEHIGRLTALASGAARVIDKLPDNIQLLGQIAVLFPNARIVLCRRDLRDCCLSAFFQQFDDGMAWTYDLSDCAERAQEIERLVAHWRAVVPLSILDVDYEDLVTDLEGQSRRLIAFLGLDWDPACLNFHATERPVMSASYWQVRQPLYTAARGRWRHYRQHLAPLLLGLFGLVPFPDAEDWDRILVDPEAALRAAAMHHQAGRLAATEAICRALLLRLPEHPAALHLLGLVTLDHGNAAEAAELLRMSLRVQPDVLPALLGLARAERLAGQPGAAVTTVERALALDDSLADAHAELAQALLDLGQLEQAHDHAQRALEYDPQSTEALFAQAKILAARAQPSAAETLWRRLLDMRPGHIAAVNGLTDTVAAQGRTTDAITIQRQVIERFPDNALLLYQLGRLLWRSQDPASAIDACKAGIALDPDQSELWLLLGNCRMFLGQFADAAGCYRRALALDPSSGAAYAGLVAGGKAEQNDDILTRSMAVVTQPALPMEQRIAAAFAVARDHEMREDYDAAFAAYTEANRLASSSRGQAGDGGLESLRGYVDWAIQTFRSETFRAATTFGSASELPGYIVGMPRSGTTLVEQIAASHPLVFGEGETADLDSVLGLDQGGHVLTPPAAWDARMVRGHVDELLATLRRRGGDAARVINKVPDNILWLGQIALLLPKARIIVCRRDLRDVCLSCFSQNFLDPNMAWTDTLEDCALRAREIERLLDHWRRVLPTSFLEVRYETLVGDLEGQSRRLIDHLGLDWDAACLSFHKTERVVMTASHWQVRQPLYATSVGRWRHYRKHLGPLLDGLRGLIPQEDPVEATIQAASLDLARLA